MGGLLCEETHNDRDRYAVAVKKITQAVIGYLPQKLSRVCSLFCDKGVQLTAQSLEGEDARQICLKAGLKFLAPSCLRPYFLLFSLVVAFSTSLLARVIACDGREEDNDPLRLGRPFSGLNKLRIDIFRLVLVCYFWTIIFHCSNN